MKRVYTVRLSAITLVMAIVSSMTSPVITMAAPNRYTNRDRNVTKSEVGQALRNTTGVMDTSATIKTTTDSDSAMKVATAGATIDVPKDADQGVTIVGDKAGAPSLSVSLPNAGVAADAQPIANGIVSYPSATGAANAVQANTDGSVRMLTVIDNPSAPTRYDYKITVPNGGTIEIVSTGGAIIYDGTGNLTAYVAPPWAKDALGKAIKTWFTTDGKTLTQYVQHNVEGVTYPVTADPLIRRWYGFDYQFNRRQTNNIMFGLAGATAAAMYIPDPTITKIVAAALSVSAGYAGWAYNNGACMKIAVFYNGVTIMAHYRGGNCR